MNRRIATLMAASALGASVLIASGVVSATAAGPTAKVAGGFKYFNLNGAFRSGSIAASASPVKGQWSWQQLRGSVTCLVIEGHDAWLAGPGTSGPDTGIFMHFHDGGAPGTSGDMVMVWGQDPGQPFAELVEWCETQTSPLEPFPLDSGNVTVKE